MEFFTTLGTTLATATLSVVTAVASFFTVPTAHAPEMVIVPAPEQAATQVETRIVNEYLTVHEHELRIVEGGVSMEYLREALDALRGNLNDTIDENDSGGSVGGDSTDLSTQSIEDLADVATMTKLVGDLFSWDGSSWSNIATSTLGVSLGDTTGTLSATRGGTGLTSFAVGDLLYADSATSFARLPIGGNGQVLKVSGGTVTWGADAQGSGGAGAFSTSSDGLAIYPTIASNVVIIGASATSTTGNIFEVAGNALYRNLVTAYGVITAPRFVATSTTASSFPYASTTAITSSHASTTAFSINGEAFNDLTGTGLQNVGGALTLNTTGDWTGTFDGQEGSWYIANSFSTTSADAWKNTRNFFSTTSADFWETQQVARTADDLTNNSIEDLSDVAAMTENFGDLLYWNGTSWADIATSSLGLPTFGYPFPSNATSTTLSFTGGLVTTYATATSVRANTAAFGATGTTTITSAGLVGIGTTMPAAQLHIVGNGAGGTDYFGSPALLALTANNSTPWPLVLQNVVAGTSSAVALFSDGDANGGILRFIVGDGAGGSTNPLTLDGEGAFFGKSGTIENTIAIEGNLSVGILAEENDVYSLGWANNRNSVPTKVLNWTTSGRVGVGTTTPTRTFSVQGAGYFTGDVALANLTATGTATTTSLVTTNLSVNAETFTDLTGTGLQNVGGALTLNATGDWTGTFDGQEGSWYVANSFSTTSAQNFVHSSTTIAKTYSANTFTSTQTFNGRIIYSGTPVYDLSGGTASSQLLMTLNATAQTVPANATFSGIRFSALDGSNIVFSTGASATASGIYSSVTASSSADSTSSVYGAVLHASNAGAATTRGIHAGGYGITGSTGHISAVAGQIEPVSTNAGAYAFFASLTSSGVHDLAVGYDIESSGDRYGIGFGNTVSALPIGSSYYRAWLSDTSSANARAFQVLNNSGSEIAYWNKDGSLYTSGSIGIATTSPYAKLSVVGEVVGRNFTSTSTTEVNRFPNLFSTNASSTNATTTNFAVLALTSQLLRTDGTGVLRGTSIGSGLSFDGTTLSATGGGGANSKWATSTGSDIYNNGGGKVGIGSSTPWGLLSVNPSGLGTNVPEFVVGSSTSTRLVVTGSGAIGLGTSTPMTGYRLVTAGNSLFYTSNPSITFMSDAQPTGGWTLQAIDADGRFRLFGNTAERLSITSSGLVGIGTTTPARTLAVLGGGYFTGDVALANITATGSATTTNLAVTALTSQLLRTDATGVVRGTTIGSGLSFDGTTLSATASGGANSKFATSTSTRFPNAIFANASQLVGIGTSTPAYQLQIASSTGPQLALSDGSATSNHWTFRSLAGNLYIATSSPTTFATSSNRLMIDAGGNVVVGGVSALPTRLTVVGGSGEVNATPYGNSQLTITNAGEAALSIHGASGSTSYIFFGTTGASGNTAGRIAYNNNATQANGSMAFFTANAEVMRLTGGGLVGIGTTTPNSALTIQSSTGDDDKGFINFTAAGTQIGAIGRESNDLEILGIFGVSLHTTSGGTAALRVLTSGNVGIGTTTPYRKLSITDAVSTSQFAVSYDTANYTTFLTNSTGDLTIDAEGGYISALDEVLSICAGGACPSGSPLPGTIVAETAVGVGSSTPWAGLSIVSGKAIIVAENTLATSTSMTIDWRNGNQQLVRLGTSGTTISFSGFLEGQKLVLTVCNPNASAGAITWGTQVLWAGGTAPTQTTTANKCDVWSFLATMGTSTLKIFGTQSANF